MSTKDKRIDAYIAKSQDFAKPVLTHLRKLIHSACPHAVETLKWGMPCFVYDKGILCFTASFKQHCTFGFWKAPVMKDPHKLFSKLGDKAMGHFGRITNLKDLPSDKIITEYLKEAAKLIREDVKPAVKPVSKKLKELVVPEYFKKALSKNKAALKTFNDFSYSNKKDYVEWVTDAKTDETRISRMKTSVEWMSEGKIRNWKYVRK